ncbi:MAG: DUF2786 domain-containing protein [Dermatophilaceae bacterium]|nr:DUF2786 domain-containing protein [Intrasporangiaceae bacterium]
MPTAAMKTTAQERARRLDELLSEAWDAGWQPGDLHSYVTRHWDPLTVKVLGDAMAADLARYAPGTVDDRWQAQLAEVSATVWWPSETSHLVARAESTAGGWPAVSASYGILALALDRLPPLERLGPRPGQVASSRTPVDVDERLLTKVRMMLAKAESTPFEAEAEAFTAAAHSLMTRHSIDRAVLEATTETPSASGPGAVRVPIPAPYARDKFSLLSAVGRANRCKAVWHDHFGFATVVGFDVDRRTVEMLFASLLVQAMVSMQGHRASHPGVNARTFRRSFLTGFTHRVAERLAQVSEAETRAASEEHVPAHLHPGGPGDLSPGSSTGPGTGPSTDIVRLLADREEAVETSVRERFPGTRTIRSRARLEAEGWYSGRAAGDRASLSNTSEIRGA